jgi:hypothetical protein
LKDKFLNYYHNPYSDTDFDTLWENCIFIFDSSVLLALYEVPKKSATSFIKILKSPKFNSRLWIPYQVGLEYQRNRLKTIINHEIRYDVSGITGNLTTKINKIKSKIDSISLLQDKYLDKSEIIKCLTNITKEVEKTQILLNKYNPDYLNDEDDIRKELDKLFRGKRVGEKIPKEEWLTEAKERREDGIPPGTEDKKRSNKKYGDYIIWKEIIQHAKTKELPVILVNNDVKGDWWLRKQDELLGPHPVLVEEFIRETNESFYMYTLNNFLKEGRKRKMATVPPETIKDFENVVIKPQSIESHFSMGIPTIITDENIKICPHCGYQAPLHYREHIEGLWPCPNCKNEFR